MPYYKTMGTDQIMYCIVALILGMLMYHMLKGVCGCKTVVEGNINCPDASCSPKRWCCRNADETCETCAGVYKWPI